MVKKKISGLIAICLWREAVAFFFVFNCSQNASRGTSLDLRLRVQLLLRCINSFRESSSIDALRMKQNDYEPSHSDPCLSTWSIVETCREASPDVLQPYLDVCCWSVWMYPVSRVVFSLSTAEVLIWTKFTLILTLSLKPSLCSSHLEWPLSLWRASSVTIKKEK